VQERAPRSLSRVFDGPEASGANSVKHSALTALVGLALGCATAAPVKQKDDSNCSASLRGADASPLEYLKMLQALGACQRGFGRWAHIVEGRRAGFVREQDLPNLVALVDSKLPCAHTASSISSWMPQKPSFVGQEALLLIEAFRQNEFPPTSNSDGFYPNRDEILAWWRDRRSQLITPR